MKNPLSVFVSIIIVYTSAPTLAQSASPTNASADSPASEKPEAFSSIAKPYPLLNLGITLAAGTALGFTQSEEDKRMHYWAGYGIASVGAWGLNHAGVPKFWASLSGLALGIVAGWAKEEYDRSKGKPFNQNDWNATNLGAGSGIAILNIPW